MVSRAAVKQALATIKQRADYEYFFSRLSSPEWLTPLLEEGLFRKPPAAIAEGDYVRFPFWPESSFLARVANKAPEEAARVLSVIPETDNVRIHQDLVDIALQIDADAAARWSIREAKWIAGQRRLHFVLPEKVAKLIAKLAEARLTDAALGLARALFGVLPDQRQDDVEKASEFRLPPNPTARCDAWQYSEALKIVAPSLARTVGLPALDVFAALLAEAVRLSSDRDRAPGVDYSFIWRDLIEADDSDETDVRDALVSAVRDIAVDVAQDSETTKAVVERLEARGWDVFRRIAFHVLSATKTAERTAIRDHLVNREAFVDPSIRHEYVMLLRAAFGSLEPSDRTTILGWIEQGPDRDDMRARHEQFTGKPPSEEEIAKWVEHWQRDRLSPLRDSLPPAWRARFDDLVARYGPPEFDLVLHRTSAGTHGLRSPLEREKISELGGPELRAFLKNWSPEGPELEGPSRTGLAQTLEGLDAAFFERESGSAEAWSDVPPLYTAALVSGFARLVEGKGNINWEQVLGLGLSIAQSEGSGHDHDWARLAIARLIDAALRKPGSLVLAQRDRVWRLLAALLERPDESEGRGRGEGAELLTSGINSARGKSLEAVVAYAIWIRNAETPDADSNWSLEARAPEVRAILDRFSDHTREPSGALRAVLGSHLESLVWLDSGWVRSRMDQLFPTDPAAGQYRAAVWETYLAYGRPFRPGLELFRREFEVATSGLGAQVKRTERGRDVPRRLADYLMSYYWHGQLPLGDELLIDFYSRADVDLKAHSLDFLGRSLRSSTAPSSEELARLRGLFDWRLETVERTADRRSASPELVSFGWWFSSGRFDAEWALNRLIRTLHLSREVEPDHMVGEALTKLVDSHPRDVVEALRLIVEGEPEHLSIMGWKDEARQILKALLLSTDSAVRGQAVGVIHALGSRRMSEFRDLLPKR